MFVGKHADLTEKIIGAFEFIGHSVMAFWRMCTKTPWC